MKSMNASVTSARDGVNIALLDWWLKDARPEAHAREIFAQVPDEWIGNIRERDVGHAALRVRDFFPEFLAAVTADQFASFAYREHGDTAQLRGWLADHLGIAIRKLPEWETRLPGIRAAQKKMKAVRSVLES